MNKVEIAYSVSLFVLYVISLVTLGHFIADGNVPLIILSSVVTGSYVYLTFSWITKPRRRK